MLACYVNINLKVQLRLTGVQSFVFEVSCHDVKCQTRGNSDLLVALHEKSVNHERIDPLETMKV